MADDHDTVATRAREIVLAGYDAAGDEVVAAALTSPEPLVRARALGAAARRGLLTDALRVNALTDPVPLVRRRACALEGRAGAHGPTVVAALDGRLRDDDPLVVVGAASALGEARATTAVDALGVVARTHRDARCREAAIGALGAIGEPASLDVVLDALDDKPAVRRRAVVALAAFSDDRVEAALLAALEDRDWQVREVATALRAVTRQSD